MDTLTAPVIACSRHRLQTDGQGVTTLVCFHGCPLRCRYCINPFSFASDTRRTHMTPAQLYEQVRQDELYFLATGGGVTFGGGEPLLYPEFIHDFRRVCGDDWHLCVETSLNVPWENVRSVSECIDHFYIDCKDINPEIYRRYTGENNAQVLENLQKLLKHTGPERITLRLPLIPHYNTEEDRHRSTQWLKEIGVLHIDRFVYRVQDAD
jgi:pyruvate formate lyase activating enzyme